MSTLWSSISISVVANRADRKRQAREERLAKEAAIAKASARKKRLILVGVVVGAALIVGLVVLFSLNPDADDPTVTHEGFPTGSVPAMVEENFDKAVEAAGCEYKEGTSEGNDHVEGPVKYKANPPTSGNHFIIPAEDGPYIVAPQLERTVHALEHGRINIQWKPGVDDPTIGALKALYDEDPYHMLLYPNETNMDGEVAVTAWLNALVCKKYNDKVPDAIRAFRERFRDQGPEFVP